MLFTICPLALFSQLKISGTVLDKTTHEPIPNVLVYMDKGTQMVLTDDDGHYSLLLDSTTIETIEFKHIAYQFFTVRTDTLLNHSNVYLSSNPVILSEVTIHPLDVQSIYTHSIQNLLTHLQTKENIPYLIHCEEKTSNGDEREVYALVESFLKTNNIKQHIFLNWNLKLLQLDQLKKCNLHNFYINGKPIFVGLFLTDITNKKFDNLLELQDTDENQFIIKVSPKQLNKKNYSYYLCTINKLDTTLIEVESQSYSNASELTFHKNKDANFQITKSYAKIAFVKDEKTDLYNLQSIIYLGNFRVTAVDNLYDIPFKVTTNLVEKLNIPQIFSKENIKPYNYSLFESKMPNSPGFWKQYVNP